MESLLELCLELLNDLAHECLRVNLVIKRLPRFESLPSKLQKFSQIEPNIFTSRV